MIVDEEATVVELSLAVEMADEDRVALLGRFFVLKLGSKSM